MGIKDLIFKEIDKVPEQHLSEVLDFIRSFDEGKPIVSLTTSFDPP
jgi:predicted protein tyrosine phosphatase